LFQPNSATGAEQLSLLHFAGGCLVSHSLGGYGLISNAKETRPTTFLLFNVAVKCENSGHCRSVYLKSLLRDFQPNGRNDLHGLSPSWRA
jgi:hypothetical protein